PKLTSIPLYDEPFWIASPNGHALSRKEDIDLGDLAGERLLLLSKGNCLRDQVLSFYSASKGDPALISTEETSLTTILALAAGGFGVALVPAMSLSGPLGHGCWHRGPQRDFRRGTTRGAIGVSEIVLADGADREARGHHRRDRSRYCGSPAALAVHFPFRRHTGLLA
ncbi:MAG: LysR substrate-binding domain-containing protein, partial [Alphaproteobacteria bacterium]